LLLLAVSSRSAPNLASQGASGALYRIYLLLVRSKGERCRHGRRLVAGKLTKGGPRKLLALDGGGIRGLIAVEVLAEMEAMLRRELGEGDDFVLSDYFDYVAGTSTGAIIASCIALGMSAETIRRFHLENGEEMFDKASLLRRFRYRYEDDRLADRMRDELGADTTLGSERLRTLLLVVMRNATTDSPWPLSNNPGAKYNRPDRTISNLEIPLWQIVRASAAAPTFFPPQVIDIGGGQILRLRRRRRHDVQQSGLSALPDGDRRAVRPLLVHGRARDAPRTTPPRSRPRSWPQRCRSRTSSAVSSGAASSATRSTGRSATC
jgi:hypothetical protein